MHLQGMGERGGRCSLPGRGALPRLPPEVPLEKRGVRWGPYGGSVCWTISLPRVDSLRTGSG